MATNWNDSPFKNVWRKALSAYYAKLPEKERINLEDSKWLDVRDIHDLTKMLQAEHEDFEEDTAQGKDFTDALQCAFGPLTLIMNMFGGAAGAAFPPCSQILGAVSVLIDAGKRVAGAFDALGGLFTDIGSFLQRLQPLTTHKMPQELEKIVCGILVCMLDVCALATRRTYHVSKKVDHYKWRHALSTAQSNVTAYFRQLILGADSEVDGAVATLKRLVDEELRMTVALTKMDTSDIKSSTTEIMTVAVEIQGLTIVMRNVTYQIQQDTTEIKFKVTALEAKAGEIKEDTSELKVSSKKMIDEIRGLRNDLRLNSTVEKLTGRSESTSLTQTTAAKKTEITPGMKQSRQLTNNLQPATTANNAVYEKTRDEILVDTGNWIIQDDYVQQWLQGKLPVVLVSGQSGFGKTFLASRVVDELLNLHKQGVQHPSRKSVGYFFCRKSNSGLSSANRLLCTLAFQIASNDQVYSKWILDKFKAESLVREDEILKAKTSVDSTPDEQLNLATNDSVATPQDNDDPSGDSGSSSIPSDAKVDDQLERHKDSADTGTVLDDAVNGDHSDQHVELTVEQQDIVELWNSLFRDFYANSRGSAHLVIDALDDFSEAERFALWKSIAQLASSKIAENDSKLSVMVFINSTCSEEAMTSLTASGTEVPHVTVNQARNNEDLKLFIDSRMTKAWKHLLVTKELYDEVKSSILEASAGNFLWSSLVVDEVTSLNREDIIRKTLASLPQDLKAAMLLVVNRFSRQLDKYNFKDLHDMLAWVACSHRNLSLLELDAILSMRDPQGARVIDLERGMRTTLSSLFVVSGQESATEEEIEKTYQRRLAQGDLSPELTKLTHDTNQNPPEPSIKESTGPISSESVEETSDDNALVRWRLEMDTRTIRIAHILIQEQLQERKAQEGLLEFTSSSMQSMVLLECLNIICDASRYPKQIAKDANKYCSMFLSKHFAAIDLSEVDAEPKIQIAKKLVQLLRDDTAIDQWIFVAGDYMANDLLSTNAFCEKVMLWLQDSDVHPELSEDDRNWLVEASSNPTKVLLHGIANGHARGWLREWNLIDGNVEFLNSYLNQIEKTASERAVGDSTDYTVEKADRDTILRIARWPKFDEDAEWYGRVGKAFREANLLNDSLEFFHKAIEMEPDQGFWQSGLSSTFDYAKDYENAIKSVLKGIELYEKSHAEGRKTRDPVYNFADYLVWDRQDLARWYSLVGRPDESIEVYAKILENWETAEDEFSSDTTLGNTALASFTVAYEAQKWEAAMDMLNRFNCHPKRLTNRFLEIYEYLLWRTDDLLRPAMETQRLDVLFRFLSNNFKTMARYGKDGQASKMRFNIALAMLRLTSEQDEAIRLLNTVISDEEILDPTNGHYWVHLVSERELGRTLFDKILHAREQDQWEVVGRFASDLVKLVKQNDDDSDVANYTANDSALILAAWNRVNGRLKRAKDFARASLQVGFDMLFDTDPDNDVPAWIYLADGLLAIGDTERTVAACNMARQVNMFGNNADIVVTTETNAEATSEVNEEELGSPDAESQEKTSTTSSKVEPSTPSSKDDTSTPTVETPETNYYWCDGQCFAAIPDKNTFWRCSYCIADFCQSCHELILAGNMKRWHICGRTHEHIEMPGVEGKYTQGTLKVGKDEAPVQAWLDQLKVDWDIKSS